MAISLNSDALYAATLARGRHAKMHPSDKVKHQIVHVVSMRTKCVGRRGSAAQPLGLVRNVCSHVLECANAAQFGRTSSFMARSIRKRTQYQNASQQI